MSIDLRRRLMAAKFDPIIIDARDGSESNIELMRIISENYWSKNALYMRKSEAERVESIGTVFKGNTKIKDFTAFSYFTGVTALDNDAFRSCTNMIIALPPNIQTIGTDAFKSINKGRITNVLPVNAESVGANAFNDSRLQQLFFGKNLNSIGTAYSVFRYAHSNIEELYCHPENQFYYLSQDRGSIIKKSEDGQSDEIYFALTTAKIPLEKSIASIGSGACMSCTVSTVEIPENITSIGSNAFSSSQIQTLKIKSMCTIQNSAFSSSTRLVNVDFGDTISIAAYAFLSCSRINSIQIPSTCTSVLGTSFQGCSGISSISVAEGNPKYDSRDNCNAIIETETNKLVRGCKNTTIPLGITSIGSAAFADSNVVNIDIPKGVTTLYTESFNSCKSLQSIVLPETITTINGFSFNACKALKTITVHAITPPLLGSNNYTNSVIDVYVPDESVEAYKASWSIYADRIKPISELPQ
jgi:hypothetical protein